MKLRTVSTLACLSIMAGLTGLGGAARAVGPNLMMNNGFEGGNQQYNLGSAFSIVNNAANAHSGNWEMQANLNNTYSNGFQSLSVWRNTNYTTTFWVKGSGTVSFGVLGSDWATSLGGMHVIATGTWQPVTLNWNSGNFTSVMIKFYDDSGSGTMYVDDFSTGLTNFNAISFNPGNPSASGFSNLIIDDEFNNSSTIDVNASGNDGYLWYPQQFFGYGTASPSMFSVSGGELTVSDSTTSWSETLHTAMPASNSQGWKGTGVRVGGGLYIEAKIKIGPNVGNIGGSGWPAFWMTDMKMNTGVDSVMRGNPGHGESVESDIMEYNPTWGPVNNFYFTMHDWSDAHLASSNSSVCMPVGTDVTQYHTYGELWVPGTAANGWQGYRQCYFDGQPQTASCWIDNQIYNGVFPETTDSMGSYLFSEVDQDVSDIIIGTTSSYGGAATDPIILDYVRVYAVSPASLVRITNGLPAAPTGLTATAGNGQATLSWTATPGATSYNIYRGTTPSGESSSPIATGITATSYTNTGLTNGTRYYYIITAVNGSGVSAYSSEANAQPAGVGNTHGGSWAAKAVSGGAASWSHIYQGVSVSANTAYTASLWIKGSGKVEFDIVNSGWTANLASKIVTATGTWQQVTLTFNSGSNTQVAFQVYDSQGNTSGATNYIDDCFLGTGTTNKLSNPGFESGDTVWNHNGIFTIAQNP